eukprot:2228811-Amphidinium_carterae.1
MPFPAPATWMTMDNVPEITLRDTSIKEISVRDLHPVHQEVFMRDPKRGRCKEWQSIVDSAAVRVHVGNEARRLQAQWPGRMIPSRWLDRWKHAGAEYKNGLSAELKIDARVEAKSRWVVQGFWDPDLEDINRSTPCPTAQDLMLMLYLLAAMGVEAHTADVRTAFMQSEPGLRGGDPLFAKLPPEGVPAVGDHAELSAEDGIVELLAEVYGLNSGPMRITLTKALQQQRFRSHPLSPCIFLFYDQQECMCGALLVETDDLLFGGHGSEFEQAMNNIKQRFKFGHWRSLQGKPADYSGRRLVQLTDHSFEVEMTSYLKEKANPIVLSKERREQPTALLTDGERTQYRGLIGSLTWASRMAMPQMAGEVSIMASRCNQSTVMDAVLVNAMLARHLKIAVPLVVQSIPLTVLKGDTSDLKVALVTDAKSVFDNVRKHQEAYTNHDKRVSLELAVVRDGLRTIGGECRWVPHFANPADCLTKLKGNVDRLLQLMKEGCYCLVNEEVTIKDRQEQRAQGAIIPRPSRHTAN